MSKITYKLYKNAREHLGLSQRQIAKELNVTGVLISKIETGKTHSPNHEYTRYLVGKGINYFYLIGESDEIEGQLMDFVSRKEYEFLSSENENLKAELKNLKQEMEEMVSRSEFEEVTHKLEAYAEIIRMLKNEKS